MKIYAILFLIVALLLAVSTEDAMANAYKSWAMGVKSTGKAGAFIGEADDWTAVHWNPAGLTQLEGASASFEPGWIYLRIRDCNSVKNYNNANTAGANQSALQGDTFLRIYRVAGTAVEPEQFEEDTYVHRGLSPSSAAGGHIYLDPVTIGFGISTPAGLVTDWDGQTFDPTNSALIKAEYYAMLSVTAYNLSIGTPITDWLSMGLGMNFLHMNAEIRAKKRYLPSAASAIGAYTFDYKEKGSGWGYEPVIGFMAKLTDDLQVGGVYRFGAKIQGGGYATAHHTAVNANEESHYRYTYYYPSTIGLGAAYKPTKKLTLTSDWELTDWRKVNRKLDFNRTGVLLQDTDLDWEWKTSTNIAVGAEYQLNPRLALRSGIRYDQSPMSQNSVSVTNVVDVDKVWYTTGLLYEWKDLSLMTSYAYTYGDDTIRGVKYSVLIHNVSAGVRYRF
jgi:long-chain fatty acid transport protein